MAIAAPQPRYLFGEAILQLFPPKPIPVPTVKPTPAPAPTTALPAAPVKPVTLPSPSSAGCGGSCGHAPGASSPAPSPVLQVSGVPTYISPPKNEAAKISLSVASVQDAATPAAEVKTLPVPGDSPRGPAELLAWLDDNGGLLFWLIVILALWGLSKSSGGHSWR